MSDGRVWLDVPFSQKDEAKRAGARWDAARRRWFAPRPGIAALARWAAAPDVPDLLPGEDRSLGSGLFVDLVPRSCWFTNVRSCVSERDWERLRRMVVRRAGNQCEICRSPGDMMRMDVHERWAYDNARRVQRLGRLICLCESCHTVTHFGFAQIRGLEDEALDHLKVIAGLTQEQAVAHVEAAFELWRSRSLLHWTLDLGILTGAGVAITRPPDAAARTTAADRML